MAYQDCPGKETIKWVSFVITCVIYTLVCELDLMHYNLTRSQAKALIYDWIRPNAAVLYLKISNVTVIICGYSSV